MKRSSWSVIVLFLACACTTGVVGRNQSQASGVPGPTAPPTPGPSQGPGQGQLPGPSPQPGPSPSTAATGSVAWNGTNIKHVVLIVQENHSFDSYFGAYGTAPAYSNPTCTSGRGCTEAAPSQDPAGHAPVALTDSSNYSDDHDHGYSCEVCEMDGGAMDKFTGGSCPSDYTFLAGLVTDSCSTTSNFAVATDPTLMSTYWSYADDYALADRYFQPIAGGSSANDMYFAVAHYEFLDDSLEPAARGAGCTLGTSPVKGTALSGRTTIADLLIDNGFSFKVYADGFNDSYAASPNCPPAGGDCPETLLTEACRFDPSDVPFEYYPQFADNQTYMGDLTELFTDVAGGNLPNFSFVKYRTSANEHPGWSYISHGEKNVAAVVNAILSSPIYADNTLILLTWDEGGGFYDHVAPPPSIEKFPAGSLYAGDPIPYGPRVPFLAIGTFARKGTISHVVMEHSSIVKFLEWNFLGPSAVGAINATDPSARDAAVNNIGSMLDPAAVGVAVP